MRIALLIIVAVMSMSIIPFASAEGVTPGAPIPFGKDISKLNIQEKIEKVDVGGAQLPVFDINTSAMRWILAALFFISGPLLFIMALYAGVNMVVRPENEEMVAKSRRILVFSVIGMVIMAFAYAVVQNLLHIF